MAGLARCQHDRLARSGTRRTSPDGRVWRPPGCRRRRGIRCSAWWHRHRLRRGRRAHRPPARWWCGPPPTKRAGGGRRARARLTARGRRDRPALSAARGGDRGRRQLTAPGHRAAGGPVAEHGWRPQLGPGGLPASHGATNGLVAWPREQGVPRRPRAARPGTSTRCPTYRRGARGGATRASWHRSAHPDAGHRRGREQPRLRGGPLSPARARWRSSERAATAGTGPLTRAAGSPG
jgi:hypothetical protein